MPWGPGILCIVFPDVELFCDGDFFLPSPLALLAERLHSGWSPGGGHCSIQSGRQWCNSGWRGRGAPPSHLSHTPRWGQQFTFKAAPMLPASFGNAFANFRAESIEPHRRVTHLPKKKQPLLCPVPSGLNTKKMAIDRVRVWGLEPWCNHPETL